jgi:hypothetical protein
VLGDRETQVDAAIFARTIRLAEWLKNHGLRCGA